MTSSQYQDCSRVLVATLGEAESWRGTYRILRPGTGSTMLALDKRGPSALLPHRPLQRHAPWLAQPSKAILKTCQPFHYPVLS